MHSSTLQDHAMMTAMLCVENILANTSLYDLWQVNGDAEYREAGPGANEETRRTIASPFQTVLSAVPGLAPEG